MHKSFSFYLNIKFFAHKILNALSFQWFRVFCFFWLYDDVACYRVSRSVGRLLDFSLSHRFLSTNKWMWRAIKGVHPRTLIHILATLHTHYYCFHTNKLPNGVILTRFYCTPCCHWNSSQSKIRISVCFAPSF